jgi:hypothetical protein
MLLLNIKLSDLSVNGVRFMSFVEGKTTRSINFYVSLDDI